MSIWTQADIEKLKTAIAGGVLEVSYDGPPARRIRYQSLAEMRSLLAEMRGEVGNNRRVRLAAHRRGF